MRRPVISICMCLEQDLTLVGCRDLQLLAVFRDGPSRQDQALALQDADDLRVAQRLSLVLPFDDLLDAVLDRDRRHRLAVRAADATVEKELHLVHALGRVHVLVGDDPADRGLVHADVVGHVAQHQWPQVLDAVVHEVALEVDDAGRDLVDGLLALLNRLDEPQRRPELVLHVGACFVGVVGGALLAQGPFPRAAPPSPAWRGFRELSAARIRGRRAAAALRSGSGSTGPVPSRATSA